MHPLTALVQSHTKHPYYMGELFNVTDSNRDEFHQHLRHAMIDFQCECGESPSCPHVIAENKRLAENERRRVLDLLEKIANKSDNNESLLYGITGLLVGLGVNL